MRKNLLAWFLIGFIVLINNKAWAYWENVHERITNEVIRQNIGSVDTWIKNSTGLTGADAFVNGQKIRKWIADGSVKEDEHISPLVTGRVLNHFYDPLTGSGLADFPFYGTSSYAWASSDGYNIWRWEMARSFFYDGLTKTAKADRDEALSKSFRAIGQVMHLVQDLSSPAHVRNDAHLTGDPYEVWTRSNMANLDYSMVPFPYWNVSISASAPKQLWDLDSYNGTTPYDSGYIGLAEYTNANFLSRDTMFKNYPHPSLANTDFVRNFGSLPIITVTRPNDVLLNGIYLSGYGKQHLAVARYFAEEVLGADAFNMDQYYQLAFTLDNECHEEYAQYLVPRAVGYSAGLLNYFFRGQLGTALVSRLVTTDEVAYGLRVKNQSTETMTSYTDPVTGRVIGNIEIYYDAIISNATPTPVTERRLIKSCPLSTTDCWQTAPLQLAPNQETEPIFFPIPTDNANPNQYTIVFRGQLGNEQGAVVAGKVNYWSEEWDKELKSNHEWLTTDEIYQHYYDTPPISYRTHEIVDGKLILENRHWGFSQNALWTGEAYDVTPEPFYSYLHYCQQKTWPGTPIWGCFTYDFGLDFPIPVTPNTMVRLKVDEASIEPIIPPLTTECYNVNGVTHQYQGINLTFDNGENLFFTVPGQERWGRVTYFTIGTEYVINIFNLFKNNGIAFAEPVNLLSINIVQTLSSNCETEHTQRMAVDYIRLEER